MKFVPIPLIALLTICGWKSRAAVTSYSNSSTFGSVAGARSIITFTEVPLATSLTTEYSSLGVTFLEGDDKTESDPTAYLSDGIGLAGGREGQLTFIKLQFSSPVNSLGVDFPGALQIDLFAGANSIGSSEDFGFSGPGHFGGVISDVPFDRAILTDWLAGDVYIDNLYVVP